MVSAPPDQQILDTDTGRSITWVASGNLPTTYTLYRDGEVVSSGNTWDISVPITYVYDGDTPGSHNYTIQLFDDNGMWASDTVIVDVESTTTTTATKTPPPFDPMIIMDLVGFGAVVVVIVLVIFVRRR